MFVFRESQRYDFETESFETVWQLVDSMVVGDDSLARSTSPPNPAINTEGNFAIMLGVTTGSLGGLLLGSALDLAILLFMVLIVASLVLFYVISRRQ